MDTTNTVIIDKTLSLLLDDLDDPLASDVAKLLVAAHLPSCECGCLEECRSGSQTSSPLAPTVPSTVTSASGTGVVSPYGVRRVRRASAASAASPSQLTAKFQVSGPRCFVWRVDVMTHRRIVAEKTGHNGHLVLYSQHFYTGPNKKGYKLRARLHFNPKHVSVYLCLGNNSHHDRNYAALPWPFPAFTVVFTVLNKCGEDITAAGVPRRNDPSEQQLHFGDLFYFIKPQQHASDPAFANPPLPEDQPHKWFGPCDLVSYELLFGDKNSHSQHLYYVGSPNDPQEIVRDACFIKVEVVMPGGRQGVSSLSVLPSLEETPAEETLGS